MCQLKKDNEQGRIKGGGGLNPTSAIFRFFFKSEGKEVETIRIKMGGEGRLYINIFFWVVIFSSGVVIFQGVEKF